MENLNPSGNQAVEQNGWHTRHKRSSIHRYIELCKKQIEKKLNWGESETWKQRDFENLSELILEEANVLLSLSTLKRIWKNGQNKAPHGSTLNVREFSSVSGDNFSYEATLKNSIEEGGLTCQCVCHHFMRNRPNADPAQRSRVREPGQSPAAR